MASRNNDREKSADDALPDFPRLRPEELFSTENVFQPDRLKIELNKLDEIASFLILPVSPESNPESPEFNPEGPEFKKVIARITRAVELYQSLEPGNGAEGMLAEQMVGTHFAALECLRRAALPGQTFAGRDMALKHAARLMKLYAEQLAALDKHRGKGQQKVTVEHVHVHAGGQAIVGNIERGASPALSAPSVAAVPAALEAAPELPGTFDDQRAAKRAQRAKSK